MFVWELLIGSELSLQKNFDAGSPWLVFAATAKRELGFVQLDTIREPFNRVVSSVRLDKVYISGYSVSMGNGVPQESFSLNFLELTYLTNELDAFIEKLARRKTMAAKFTPDQLTGLNSSLLSHLAIDHLYVICGYLSPQDLESVSLTCKMMFKVAHDESFQVIQQAKMTMSCWKESRHKFEALQVLQ
eukprot:TRINITY_DN6198_c0_g1_i1.p1 TRINITY_DN6198_c0_g1~~TRINITY_DN6198_c0_g1_i1.p1  ORF type:complete len:188 (+),score=19.66 TRINITY_DN6198_c0_g1_i1:217-780(+)